MSPTKAEYKNVDKSSNSIEQVGYNRNETEEIHAQDIISKNIIKASDGVYRWNYNMNMWKNYTLLITIWKVFILCGSLPIVFVAVLELFEQGLNEAISLFIPMIIWTFGLVTILVIIIYSVYAIVNGGSYQVVFELDSKGLNHIQMQKQFKKNQVIATLATIAGLASGNLQTTGAGLLAMSKQNSYSEFEKVKKITCKASREVIYLNENLQHNQVYVYKEDFNQVKRFIVSHCRRAKVEDK